MDTQALQKLVACGGMVPLPRLTFQVDSAIYVPRGTVIDGAGAVVESHHGGYVFLINGVHDVCIRNLEIRGPWLPNLGDDSAGLGAGIQIQESSNITVANVRIEDMLGRGIVAASNVKGLKIRDCHIDNTSISVFLFKGVRYSWIEANHIFNSRIMGIFIDDGTEGDTQDTAVSNEYTIVSGNMVLYGGTSPRNMGVGIGVSGSTDTIISGNIVRFFGNETRISHGIVLNNGQSSFNQGRRTVVSGNILSDHTGYGFYAMGQQSVVESGNVYANNGSGDMQIIPKGKRALWGPVI